MGWLTLVSPFVGLFTSTVLIGFVHTTARREEWTFLSLVRDERWRFVFVWLIVPMFLFLLVSWLSHPIFGPIRYILPVSVPPISPDGS